MISVTFLNQLQAIGSGNDDRREVEDISRGAKVDLKFFLALVTSVVGCNVAKIIKMVWG